MKTKPRIRSRNLWHVALFLGLMSGAMGCKTDPPKTVPEQGSLMIQASALQTWLTAQKGKVVVINLWATWCPPCVQELPDLQTFAQKHPDVAVLAVSLDDPAAKGTDVQAFLHQQNLLTLPIKVLDSANPIRELAFLDPNMEDVLPTTYVIGKDGKVAAFVQGGQTEAEFAQLASKGNS